MALKLFARKKEESPVDMDPVVPVVRAPSKPKPMRHEVFEPAKSIIYDDDPLRRQLQLERFGIIASSRDYWADHKDIDKIYAAALAQIDERFNLVPDGFASLPMTVNDEPGCPELDLEVNTFLLARYPITNAQFQKFVDVGAYSELDLWPEEIWPHLIDFKDQTGEPGPRFWRNGRHNAKLSDHPAVGICYCEAAAYAYWAGYRLPTEAEWQMAASWRIRSSANVLRRYPWGDAFDVRRCNIWASGVGATVPVGGYEAGAAPNGVLQLVGNVWEWTQSDCEIFDSEGNPVVGDMLLKSVRGGAFDTYFPAQATSSFRTGVATLARVHNVGFRCALDLPQQPT